MKIRFGFYFREAPPAKRVVSDSILEGGLWPVCRLSIAMTIPISITLRLHAAGLNP